MKLVQALRHCSVLAAVALCGALAATSAFGADSTSNSDYPVCQANRFKGCACAESVPQSIQYRPTFAACGGKAAVILSGPFLRAFSVVVRDNENRDRWPATGSYGGCSQAERDLGLARCSAFKAQKTIYRTVDGRRERIACFGAAGSSSLFTNVTRITVKISDRVNEFGQKKMFRACIADNYLPLN